ncbi:DNA replication regulator sld2 [Cadophora gregata]|uniref:DNA replication regulator sld2 n=1 Tax=Cadophora gregata TaxID=51156 RepID=UPI0026DD0C9D|nr:DNA replication regulator sld2 [Cadophora gregata]KAK0114533.1 DNA replication regulator sld2 [Cadophora gregata]
MVLGLFDLLEQDITAATPSRRNAEAKGLPKAIHATPRKAGAEIGLKGSKTPGSGRRLLDAFATPAKNRHIGEAGTPSSVSELHFNTPSFLRRDNHRIQLPAVNEEGPELSPQMVRVPRKPLVRGLSSMLAGLRKMEDQAADDDLDALREMEMEMEGSSMTVPRPKPNPTSTAQSKPNPIQPATKENILVADSQTNLVGAFDDEAQFDSEAESPEIGRDGQPLKVYKKKGQKRTTRRVKMKPTRSKPSQPSKTPAEDEDSDDEVAGPSDIVPETQIDGGLDDHSETDLAQDTFEEAARNFDSDSQSEYTASEGGTRYKRPDQSKKRKGMTKDGKIRSVAKKVNAMAHQNFKRLKLRNSGAKGGPAHNSRFRRKK